MSRSPIFEGVLRKPRLLSDVASLMTAVDKAVQFSIDDSTIKMQASRQEFEAWVRLNNETIFQSSVLNLPLQMTLSADSLQKALSSDNGGSRSVLFAVERKSVDTLMVTLRINAASSTDLTIRQRLYANSLDPASIPQEPDASGLPTIYVKLRRSQLDQLARISDQYRHITSKLQIELKRHQFDADTIEMSLVASQPGLDITTTLDTTPVTLAMSQSDSSSQLDLSSAHIFVRSADWCSMLLIRKAVSEVVIGLSDEQVLAVYATIDGIEENTITFYLYQQLS